MLASLALVAIVAQDNVALRAAPRETAARQAQMWQGDSLEIRGEKGDYVQVWDHRRERGGYVRSTQLRRQSLQAENAGELLAVLRFLRDSPGAESLGIAYAAAYLRAAPAGAIGAEAFDALGTLAERLARRASAAQAAQGDATLAGQLEVAAAYGVTIRGFESAGRMQMCYDGEAFRRVLALPATPAQKAGAALALTRHDCLAPEMPPLERIATDQWRADLLDRVDTGELPEMLKNRVRMRRAGVWAAIAHQRARQGAAEASIVAAGSRAIDELAAVNKSELSEDDAGTYADAAVRVGASRWAAVGAAPRPGKLQLTTRPGQPGETCVELRAGADTRQAALLTRCTYAVVWPASATANAAGTALTLAVQPLEAWREMWVFRRDADGWHAEVLPPAAEAPGLGYVEFAGWVPGGTQLLAAREARVAGRVRRSFELLRQADLGVERRADRPEALSVFYRWQDAGWKKRTVALR